MAHGGSAEELPIVNGTKIVVIVQQSLPDLILVSFENGNRVFQGVLLDSSKGHLPCGIYPPSGSYPPPPNLSSDKLFAVKQRHSYFCDDSDAKKGPPHRSKHSSSGGSKQKSPGRPSVRLRPRQVLCSTCRSICNEKNESVGGGKGVVGAKTATQSALGPKALFGNITTGPKAAANKGTALQTTVTPKTVQSSLGVKETVVSAGGASKGNFGKLVSEATVAPNKGGQGGGARESARAAGRETRQSSTSSGRETRLSSTSPSLGVSTRVKRKCAESSSSSSILVPKLKKLRLSEIEKASINLTARKEKGVVDATSKPNSSPPKDTVCKENLRVTTVNNNTNTKADVSESDATSSLSITNKSNRNVQISEDKKVEGKIPKLKLSAVNRKVPKVTISTASLRDTCANESLATRPRNSLGCSSYDKSGSNIELKEHPAIPKIVLSTSGSSNSELKEQPTIPKMILSTSSSSISEIKEKLIPKMILSTSGSCSSNGEIKEQPAIPKMVLSTSGILTENLDSKKATGNGSKSGAKLGNSIKEKAKSSSACEGLLSTHGINSNRENIASPVPKVTILPFGQKRPASDTPAKSVDPVKGKSRGGAGTKDAQEPEFSKPLGTPLLKICIGPDGTGTITNISPKSGTSAAAISGACDANDTETEEEQTRRAKASVAAKAAKRALKKAKKEAQRKTMMGCASPSYTLLGGISPRFGGMSPLRLGGGMSPARPCLAGDRLYGASPARFGGASPGRFGGSSPGRFGGVSPGRFGGTSPARFGGIGALSPVRAPLDLSNKDSAGHALAAGNLPKKHKHKVKHKKKHKEERRHKQSCAASDPSPGPGLHKADASSVSTLSTSPGSSEVASTPLKLKTTLSFSKDHENLVVTVSESSLTWRHQDGLGEATKSGNNYPHVKSVCSSLTSASSAHSSRTSSPVVPVRQKLSLSIKRLNNDSNEYVACDSNSSEAASFTTETSDKDGFASESSESSLSFKSRKKSKKNLGHDPSSSSRPPLKKKLHSLMCLESMGSIVSSLDGGESASSDEQSEVPDFPPVPETPKPASSLALKFRWRDITSCYIRPLYSQSLRLLQIKDDQLKYFPLAREVDPRFETSVGGVNTTTVTEASSGISIDDPLESIEAGLSRVAGAATADAGSTTNATDATVQGGGADGSTSASHLMSVGDIVWGKIHGFPWWPAKITGLRVLEDGFVQGSPDLEGTPSGRLHPQETLTPSSGAATSTRPAVVGPSQQQYGPRSHEAHVNWFGSSTTSMMDPAYLQPFLEFYKQRYIKKKRGPYRGAVKQAALEAEAHNKRRLEEQQRLERQKQERLLQSEEEPHADYIQGGTLDDSKRQKMTLALENTSTFSVRYLKKNSSERDQQSNKGEETTPMLIGRVSSSSDESARLGSSSQKLDQQTLSPSVLASLSGVTLTRKAPPHVSSPQQEGESAKKPKKVILRRNNKLNHDFSHSPNCDESNTASVVAGGVLAITNAMAFRDVSCSEGSPYKPSNDSALEDDQETPERVGRLTSAASESQLGVAGNDASQSDVGSGSKVNIDPSSSGSSNAGSCNDICTGSLNVSNKFSLGMEGNEQFSFLRNQSCSEKSDMRSVSASDEQQFSASDADTISARRSSPHEKVIDTNSPSSYSSCSPIHRIFKSSAAADTSNCDTMASSRPGQAPLGGSGGTEDTGVAVSHSATYCSNLLYSSSLVGSRNFSNDSQCSSKEDFNIYGSKQGTRSVSDESPVVSNTIDVSSVFSDDNFKTYPKFKTSKVNTGTPPLLPMHVLPPGLGLSSGSIPYGFREVAESVSDQCSASSEFVVPATGIGETASSSSTHGRPSLDTIPSTYSPSCDPCLSTLPGKSPIPDLCSSYALGGGCSPDVENSPGEPRLGSPAPTFMESPEFPVAEALSVKNKNCSSLLTAAASTKLRADELSFAELASGAKVDISVKQKRPAQTSDCCTVSDGSLLKCDVVDAEQTESMLKSAAVVDTLTSAKQQNITISVKSRSYLLGCGSDSKDVYGKDIDVKETAPSDYVALADMSQEQLTDSNRVIAPATTSPRSEPLKSLAGPPDVSALVQTIGPTERLGQHTSTSTFGEPSKREPFGPSTSADGEEAEECPTDNSSTPPAHLATSPREVDVFS